MNLSELLRQCATDGIGLAADGEQLRLSFNGARPEPALLAALKAHKPELLALLRRSAPVAIPRLADRRRTRVSFAQRRLWFVDRYEGGQARQYNIPAALRLAGRIDAAAIATALRGLLQRHEVLRARFVESDGEVWQCVDDIGALPLQQRDLSSTDSAARESAVAALKLEEAAHTFDLARDYPLRVLLLTLAQDDYLLLLTLHHIAADGGSIPVLLREFEQLYAAACAGAADPLPPLALQYGEYAEWQRTNFDVESTSRELAYWRDTLSGAPVVNGLPLDFPRGARETYRGAQFHQHFDAELRRALLVACKRCDATPFVFLQTVFALLLARLGRQSDVVVGFPVAGRSQPHLDALVGLFVNNLALRTRIDGNPRFDVLLRTTRQQFLDSLAHAELPFERLVDAVVAERSGHHPVFQIVFGYNELRQDAPSLAGVAVAGEDLHRDTAKVDLELSVADTGERLVLGWIYNADLFRVESVRAFARSFEALLIAVLADPARPVDDYTLIDGRQRVALLERGRGRCVARDPGGLYARFAQQAARTPNATAVHDVGITLSYAQLQQRCVRLAAYIHASGAAADARIGICLEPSAAALVAVLASACAGHTYVPLEPSHPRARQAFVIDDARIDLVLTRNRLLDGLPLDRIDVTLLDDCEQDDWLAAYDAACDATRADGTLAYILYTSGTTGQPKGVMVAHSGLCNYLDYAADAYCSGPVAGAVVGTPLCFDATLTSLLAPLLRGQAVAFLPQGDALLPALASQLFDASAGWVFKLTPAHLDALLQLRPSGFSVQPHVLVVGGDQLAAALVRRLGVLLPNALIVNEYGPTETVVGCSTWFVAAEPAQADATPTAAPIGRPIDNTRLYVLDANGQLQAPGGVGELYIGGAGVALGYAGRDVLSAQRFLPDAFVQDTAARVYRSGDLVRWNADGELVFLGRADRQVKLRGYRIELDEVEAQLRAIDGVAAAAVAVVDGAGGERALAGYFVPVDATGADALPDTIRRALAERLPDYMVPALFAALDQMPLTVNGKTDYRALAALGAAPASRAGYDAPRNVLEDELARLWQELLGIERVGIRDNFFALGGHSILAMRMTGAVRQRLGMELTLRALFEQPTIATLVPVLQAQVEQAVLPAIRRDAQRVQPPLSFAQQRLWFLDELEGGSSQFNMPAALRLKGELDVAALRRAISRIVERHEVLRTQFVEVDGAVYQVARTAVDVPVPLIDLSGLSAEERGAEVLRRAQADAVASFDLASDLLLRVQVLKLSEDEHAVLFNLHHIASDGWSQGILVRELSTLYAAYRLGQEDPLPALGVQYADYAAWQRDWLQGEVLERELGYWREQLVGAAPVHGLALDRPRPVQQRFRGGLVENKVPVELSQSLQRYARAQGATLFMLLQSAFALLLARYSGESDIVMGTSTAGRTHQDVEGLIGFFINTLVLRSEVRNVPFGELLAQNRERILGAYSHAQVPFEMLVETLKPERSLSYNPLVQVLFSLNNTASSTLSLGDVSLEPLGVAAVGSQYDLELNARESAEGIALGWQYNVDLFEEATIGRMAQAFAYLLDQIAAGTDTPVWELDLLDGVAKNELQAWNATALEPIGDTLVGEIEAHAVRTPDAVALRSGDESLSYAQLNAQANRIAHVLGGQGVTKQSLVGVCAERSIAQLVGVLAVLKAGAAYVPLDPSQPEGRLEEIVAEAGIAVVLCQSELLEESLFEETTRLPLDGRLAQRLYAMSAETNPGISQGSDLAYVLYTSGSTGRPKGVEVTQRAVLDYCAGAQQRYYAKVLRGSFVMTSLSFDLTVPGVYLPWLSGGCVTLAGSEELTAVWRELSAQEEPRLVRLTPSHVRALAGEGIDPSDTAHVFVIGGEALSGADLSLLRQYYPRSRQFNHYGPTEAIVGCSAYEATQDRQSTAVPIGGPLGNAQLFVVGHYGALAPQGAPGELYVGRRELARGYRGQAELTQEKFITDRFGAYERLYRTGDRVRRRSDGELEFLGRLDHQVKVRGYRIELGEIEARLSALAPIHSSAVQVCSGPGGELLVAYLVPAQRIEVDEEVELQAQRQRLIQECRDALKQQLPGYMVPTVYVVLEALPLSANGKVDRKALPEPGEDALQRAAYMAPRTDTEATLCTLWADVLGLQQVGIHDNFFDLGGHSLLATRLISQVRQRLNCELPLRALFEQPTVAGFAAIVSSADSNVLPAINPVQRDELTLEYAIEEGEI